MWSVMNSGPVAQFRPMESRSACAMEAQNASAVWPGQHGAHGFDGARDHHRNAPARARARRRSMASSAALTLRVSWRSRPAEYPRRPRPAPWPGREKLSISCGKVTPPVTVMALVVGPMEPATKRGLRGGGEFGRRLPRQSRGGEVQFVGVVLQAVFGQHQRRAAEGVGLDDVGAGLEIGAVDRPAPRRAACARGSRCSPRAPARRNRRP